MNSFVFIPVGAVYQLFNLIGSRRSYIVVHWWNDEVVPRNEEKTATGGNELDQLHRAQVHEMTSASPPITFPAHHSVSSFPSSRDSSSSSLLMTTDGLLLLFSRTEYALTVDTRLRRGCSSSSSAAAVILPSAVRRPGQDAGGHLAEADTD